MHRRQRGSAVRMHIDNSPEMLDLSVRIHTDNNTNPGSMAKWREKSERAYYLARHHGQVRSVYRLQAYVASVNSVKLKTIMKWCCQVVTQQFYDFIHITKLHFPIFVDNHMS